MLASQQAIIAVADILENYTGVPGTQMNVCPIRDLRGACFQTKLAYFRSQTFRYILLFFTTLLFTVWFSLNLKHHFKFSE